MRDLDQAIRKRLGDRLHNAMFSDEAPDALLAVLDLHKPEEIEGRDSDGEEHCATGCTACEFYGSHNEWPCPTVLAIAEKLGVDHD